MSTRVPCPAARPPLTEGRAGHVPGHDDASPGTRTSVGPRKAVNTMTHPEMITLLKLVLVLAIVLAKRLPPRRR